MSQRLGREAELGEQESVCFAGAPVDGSTASGLSGGLSALLPQGIARSSSEIPLPLLGKSSEDISVFLLLDLAQGLRISLDFLSY